MGIHLYRIKEIGYVQEKGKGTRESSFKLGIDGERKTKALIDQVIKQFTCLVAWWLHRCEDR